MTVRQPRYTKEEFARRGDLIYENHVVPKVEEGNHGRIVALDIVTGAFEVADDRVTASDRLLSQHPDAQTWFIQIGQKGDHHFGEQSLKEPLYSRRAKGLLWMVIELLLNSVLAIFNI